jgi:acyl carrier protein
MLSTEERDAIHDILMEQLGVTRAQLTPDARIDQDLNSDSLLDVEIVMALEERFGLTLRDDLVEQMRTVQDVEDAIGAALHPHRAYSQIHRTPWGGS